MLERTDVTTDPDNPDPDPVPAAASHEPLTHDVDEARVARPSPVDVVVVEGESALAEMLEYSVSNAGRTALTFRAGHSAIEYLAGDLPVGHAPVVLLDLDLLGTEGFLALKHILAARPSLRVIVLSAQGAERDQIRALRAGAVDYLVKPLSIPILVAKVERLLADRTP